MNTKRIVRILVVFAVLAAAAGAYVWSQGGSVPAWYPRTVRPDEPVSVQQPRGDEDADALLRRLRRDGSVTIDGEDLARLATEGLAGGRDGREFLRVSRGLEGRVQDGEIEVGGVFDLSAIDEAALSEGTRDGLSKLRQTVPFLVSGERYLGVRGAPRVAAGALAFDDGATLRIGEVGLPVALIGWLSSDADAARLDLPGLRVTAARVAGDRITVAAEPRSP
jgi:hypothetical protein